jgi:3-hydroxymyristoyl/3-hydroxydecanoyl-(acyl carrier protein) dehydratase
MYSEISILSVLPHRYPFLMIDKIVEQKFKTRAVCQKNVTLGEEVLTGHFRDNPIYPGVLLIEMGLQTTQVMMTDLEKIAALSSPSDHKADQGYILSVEKFKFSKPVHPGDVLKIESINHGEVLEMIKSEIKITNQDNVEVASGYVVVSGAK